MPLDEKALRRKAADGTPLWHESACVPIRLCDGQEWWFPRPMAVISSDGPSTTYGTHYDRLLRQLDSDEPGATVFDLAVFLLGRNYSIPNERWGDLIRFSADSEEDDDVIREICRVARGTPSRSVEQWMRCARIMALGYKGSLGLDDANLITIMAITAGTVPSARLICPDVANEAAEQALAARGASF